MQVALLVIIDDGRVSRRCRFKIARRVEQFGFAKTRLRCDFALWILFQQPANTGQRLFGLFGLLLSFAK